MYSIETTGKNSTIIPFYEQDLTDETKRRLEDITKVFHKWFPYLVDTTRGTEELENIDQMSLTYRQIFLLYLIESESRAKDKASRDATIKDCKNFLSDIDKFKVFIKEHFHLFVAEDSFSPKYREQIYRYYQDYSDNITQHYSKKGQSNTNGYTNSLMLLEDMHFIIDSMSSWATCHVDRHSNTIIKTGVKQKESLSFFIRKLLVFIYYLQSKKPVFAQTSTVKTHERKAPESMPGNVIRFLFLSETLEKAGIYLSPSSCYKNILKSTKKVDWVNAKIIMRIGKLTEKEIEAHLQYMSSLMHRLPAHEDIHLIMAKKPTNEETW